ncbi:WD40-repeat-containing domain protein [Dipodascopsis tothii]|uniref:WD40-repeat-containing domain protein n=1 Tax=Dipodascopsis tothii TaxID=44089 RepID=UPI0034CF264E
MESEQAGQAKVKINLTTRDASVAVPDVPLYVPVALKRYGLSEIVNHLLGTEQAIPFDFLINSQLLRTSLEQYLVANGLSVESTLTLEYTKSILPPTFVASFLHPDWVSSVSVSAAQDAILSGGYDGVARTWTISGEQSGEYTGAHSGPIKAVAWMGDRFLSAGMDRTVRLWTRGDGDDAAARTPAVFVGHKAAVDALAAGHGSHSALFLTGSADNNVGLWTSNTKEAPTVEAAASTGAAKRRRKSTLSGRVRGAKAMLEGHTAPVSGVVFDGKDCTVGYSVSQDHTIRTHDLVTARTVDTRTTGFPLLSVAHLPELSLLCCGSSARHITLHDPRSATTAVALGDARATQLNGHGNFVVGLAPSPESTYMFASASHDGTVRVWDVRAERALYTIARDGETVGQKDATKVFGVDWTGGVGIVAAGEDKKVQINRGTGLAAPAAPAAAA